MNEKSGIIRVGLAFVFFLQIMVGIAGVFGWGLGVYKLTRCDFKPSYKAEILYGFGTCTGTGAVIGYLDLGK